MSKNIHTLKHLKKYRKELRNNTTPAETKLWYRLQNKKLGERKFRRQHSVGNYILDFYCPSEKLCVELDGAGHFTPEGKAKDEKRTAFLNKQGIKVIRFENKEVFEDIEAVLMKIWKSFIVPGFERGI